MKNSDKINLLVNDSQSIFNNIEWNLGGLVGIASLVLNPKLVNITQAPLLINADDLEVDGLQCLGVALLEKDRQARSSELIAMAKRTLVCESLEMTADFLVRSTRILNSGQDPYDKNENFNVNIKELWNSKEGKAGSLITSAEMQFFEKCSAPLRNIIRHNNGRLSPNRKIIYKKTIENKSININSKWEKGTDNRLILQLDKAYDIFCITRSIVSKALNNASNLASLSV
jgi:hypothetical protein